MFKHITNLKSLTISSIKRGEIHQGSLPGTLEELTLLATQGILFWKKVPRAVKKLTLYYTAIDLSLVPEGVIDLTVICFDFKPFAGQHIRFPSTLKIMMLSCGSLVYPKSIEFPDELETLTLEIKSEKLKRRFKYPPRLKELTIRYVYDLGVTISIFRDPEDEITSNISMIKGIKNNDQREAQKVFSELGAP